MDRWLSLTVIFALGSASGNFHALLVAGSNGMQNYRHQADLCHAYHLLVFNLGADPQQVYTMMFDDVAWCPENPLPGRLYNEPNGWNVYRGCKVSDREVTSARFLEVLNSYAEKELSEDSTLFIYFVDHGSPGRLLFPFGDSVNGNELLPVLSRLSGFKRVVFYIEACYAASIFSDTSLPSNLLVVTASNSTESSWATFCPTVDHPWADSINGIHVGSCLGDLFSVIWMYDLGKRQSEYSTLGDHLRYVQEIVAAKSNVLVLGNKALLDEPLFGVFPKRKSASFLSKLGEIINQGGNEDEFINLLLSSATLKSSMFVQSPEQSSSESFI